MAILNFIRRQINSTYGPSKEHTYKIWFQFVQRFLRSFSKCFQFKSRNYNFCQVSSNSAVLKKIKMWKVYRQTMDAKWWQKITWPLARWANNLRSDSSLISDWTDTNSKLFSGFFVAHYISVLHWWRCKGFLGIHPVRQYITLHIFFCITWKYYHLLFGK